MSDYKWLLSERIYWRRTSDPVFPFVAEIGRLRLELYSGEWPTEEMWIVYVNGRDEVSLGRLPSNWSMEPPKGPPMDPATLR
jgi:hypothetical protein